jgi:hypothetical protein
MENASPSPAPKTVRLPTPAERQGLASWLVLLGYDPEDAALTAESAFAAVHDDYATGCPGYVGKVMSVVWDGGPSAYDVFTWEDGAMVHVEKDHPTASTAARLLAALDALVGTLDVEEVAEHDLDGHDPETCALCEARAAVADAKGG